MSQAKRASVMGMVRESGEQLFGIELLVYEELKRVLRARTMPPCELNILRPREVVAAAFANFFPAGGSAEDTIWFYIVAARCMRCLLVERATAALYDGNHMRESSARLLKLHDALKRLQSTQPQSVRIVELYYFADCAPEEIATLMRMPSRSVAAEFRFIRAWLVSVVEDEPE